MHTQLASAACLGPSSLRHQPIASQRHTARAPVLRIECSNLGQRAASGVAAVALSLTLAAGGASARLEGVNKPELLPPGAVTPVIDVAGFLTEGEETRIRSTVESLEADTGVKLRVLAQNYPQTPGLAIKDYWGVDADTVVFVADPNTGNILNFNVGENVDFKVPRNFWSRLAGRFGTKVYWQKQGQDVAIVNAVAAIDNCLREPIGRGQCSSIRGVLE
ncbi:hypothetical protein D9Q98_000109 [Chlorella vulgaris]|uniref:TPM domain-containing protein n=1 Tax=Chlorella vulgaris TaxID=3077 RepID=A0A9D4TXJ1_CHLVU|nr:hypothetical protein D9Q98_000109 [Chlorella vulgaris]